MRESEIHGHAANARKRIEHPVAPEGDPLAEWLPVAAIEDEVEALLAKRKAAGGVIVIAEKRADGEAGWAGRQFADLRRPRKKNCSFSKGSSVTRGTYG